MSRGAFAVQNAGVFGPTVWRHWFGRNDSQQDDDVVGLLEASGFDFRASDANGDGVIENSELAIVVFTNEAKVGGKNRAAANPKFNHPDCSPTASGTRVCASVVFVTQQVNFETITHELSHSLGTLDLYGDNYVKGERFSRA